MMSLIKRIREERGSALIMVLFIFLLFTILGTAVLSATIGGAQRTATRESDVQSLHLTEKSLDEAAAYITSELNGWGDISPDLIEGKIKNYVAKLKLSSLSVNTNLSSASGKITDITYMKMTPDLVHQAINYYITITGEADVNGVKRQMKREIKIDTYPDFLKYALGSGEDLIINGAAAVNGNIYAGNDLRIRKMATYVYNLNPSNVPTLYPELAGATGYGEAHVQSLDHVFYSESSSAGDTPVKTEGEITPEKATVMRNKFKEILDIPDLDHVVIKNKSKFVEINVEESFLDKIAEAAGPSSDRNIIKGKYYSGDGASLIDWIEKEPLYNLAFKSRPEPIKPTEPELPIYPVEETVVALKNYYDLLDKYKVDLKDYRVKLTEYEAELFKLFLELSESAIYNGDLTLDKLKYGGLTYTESAKDASKWFIVKGDLTIDNFEESPLPIRGNILVTGNVTIRGNVSFDSTMFVLGDTKVEDAMISGLGGKELVLISKGSILINRYDKFSDIATELNGFFYTAGSAELYGVGSIFKLRGGFFANGGMTINAVLGKVAGSHPNLTFQPQEKSNTITRFEVIYNPDIYTHQKAGLPRVQQVNVTVGPIQLVATSAHE
jgi:hypothetical protein